MTYTAHHQDTKHRNANNNKYEERTSTRMDDATPINLPYFKERNHTYYEINSNNNRNKIIQQKLLNQ